MLGLPLVDVRFGGPGVNDDSDLALRNSCLLVLVGSGGWIRTTVHSGYEPSNLPLIYPAIIFRVGTNVLNAYSKKVIASPFLRSELS